jgi:hypothetical protein
VQARKRQLVAARDLGAAALRAGTSSDYDNKKILRDFRDETARVIALALNYGIDDRR